MEQIQKESFRFVSNKKETFASLKITEEKEIKENLKLSYYEFLKSSGAKDSTAVFKQYRSAIRVYFGFDIPQTRTRKKISPIEAQACLFE